VVVVFGGGHQYKSAVSCGSDVACDYFAVEDDTNMCHSFGGTSVVTKAFDSHVTGM
jgi:hypothetical protein